MDNPFENSDSESSRTESSRTEPSRSDLLRAGKDTSGEDTHSVPATSQTSQPISSGAATEEERASIITARGTAEGLVLRIDARVEAGQLKTAVAAFVESRRSFLGGNEIALEWVGAKPEEILVQDISALLERKFDITVRTSRMRPQVTRQTSDQERPSESSPRGHAETPQPFSVVTGNKSTMKPPTPITSASTLNSGAANSGTSNSQSRSGKPISLFDGIESLDERAGGSASGLLWDEPDARVVYTTLRSGQKIETEHSVVIFGDVNSGAEVIAGGDIVVLGTLRGIAHAGAYDETGGGRVIFCLNMQPTQLRIGTVISRGLSDDRIGEPTRSSEIARVQNNLIVVEAYQSRAVWGRRRG